MNAQIQRASEYYSANNVFPDGTQLGIDTVSHTDPNDYSAPYIAYLTAADNNLDFICRSGTIGATVANFDKQGTDLGTFGKYIQLSFLITDIKGALVTKCFAVSTNLDSGALYDAEIPWCPDAGLNSAASSDYAALLATQCS